MQISSVTILGCGWLGEALAKDLIAKNIVVFGTTTRAHKIEELRKLGISSIVFCLGQKDSLRISCHENQISADIFLNSDILVMTLPVSKNLNLAEQEQGYENIFAEVKTKAIVYISSTSVYGSLQGVVNEETEPIPDNLSGQRQYELEKKLNFLALKYNKDLSIVRSAGQIGETRHPGKFLSGRRNLSDGNAPVNMIHQVDLIQIVAALCQKKSPQLHGSVRFYNAVARSHPLKKEFYHRAALDIGLEPPEFVDQGSDGELKDSYKIVLGDSVRNELDVVLTYDELFDFFK